MRRALWGLVPLLVLGGLIGVFASGLGRNPEAIPSPLVGKPAPAFSLPSLTEPGRMIGTQDFRGDVVLVNVFASWCASCVDETRSLAWLDRQGVAIYGLDYSDTRNAAQAWLQKWGNPYRKVAFDPQGAAALDWGVYGVPETFVVDRKGRVQRKFTGPISLEAAKTQVLPLVRRLETGS